MQETMQESSTGSSTTPKQRLREQRVRDLVLHKRQLVDVPHSASLAETMNALVTNRVLSVPVAAPPGHWIGAGGSMIMEADQETCAVRKQYIGIVTMLDILVHIVEDAAHGVEKVGDDQRDLEKKMAAPVSSIIGHNLEGLSLWTFNTNTSILDCMEVLSKGIHRALVPIDSHMENIPGVELAESAPSYRMLTQMDVVRYLKDHVDMEGIVTRSIRELGAVSRNVYVITDRTKVIEAIKCMRATMINAVPIVSSEEFEHDHSQLLNLEGQGRKLMGTFSATDLRGCHLATLQSWLSTTALDFTEKISKSPLASATVPHEGGTRPREPVTCTDRASLAEAMDKAVDKHVHRVWVVDQQGQLTGVVSLTDMIRVLRVAILSA